MLSDEDKAELDRHVGEGLAEQDALYEYTRLSVETSPAPRLSPPAGKMAIVQVDKVKEKPMPALLHDRRWGYD
jgi:hypothetical protein